MLVRRHMQGFTTQRAHRALTATHDCGTEPALGWLVENADKLDQEVDEQQHMSSQPSAGPSVGKTTSCSTAPQLRKSLKMQRRARHCIQAERQYSGKECTIQQTGSCPS